MALDHVFDRSAYAALRLDSDMLIEHFGSDDLLPLWVTDVDFRTPDAIVEALANPRVRAGAWTTASTGTRSVPKASAR